MVANTNTTENYVLPGASSAQIDFGFGGSAEEGGYTTESPVASATSQDSAQVGSVVEPTDEVEEVASDYFSTLNVRTPVEGPSLHNNPPPIHSVPKVMKMDFSRMIEKDFPLTSVVWNVGATPGADILNLGFPSCLIGISYNRMVSAAFDLSSLYRAKACFVIQVAGTAMHSGMLLAAVVPRATSSSNSSEPVALLHSYQANPHGYLSATSSEVVCVDIPFFSNTKLRHTYSTLNGQDELGLNPFSSTPSTYNNDYAQLRIRVLSGMGVPSGGSAALTVTIAVRFKSIDSFIPKVSYTQCFSKRNCRSQRVTIVKAKANKAESQDLDIPKTSVKGLKNVAIGAVVYKLLSSAAEHAGDLATNFTQSGLSTAITRAIDSSFVTAKSFTHDVLDDARGWIRTFTGLHSPNIRNPEHRTIVATRNNPNYVDDKTFYYKLDPFSKHVTPAQEAPNDSTEDDNLVAHIVSKPAAVARITIPVVGPSAGTVLFTAPIHPCMFRNISVNTPNVPVISAPIEKLARLSRFYSGDLQLVLQNAGSNFHMYKILVAREYYSSYQMSTTVPAMSAIQNHMTDIIEFSSGGQQKEVVLPMGSIFDHIPISPDYWTNCAMHGRVIIYLYQPIVANGTVASSVDLLVHLKAMPNFTLYGYSTDFFASNNFPITLSESGDTVTFPKDLDIPLSDLYVMVNPKRIPWLRAKDLSPLFCTKIVAEQHGLTCSKPYVNQIGFASGELTTVFLDSRGFPHSPSSYCDEEKVLLKSALNNKTQSKPVKKGSGSCESTPMNRNNCANILKIARPLPPPTQFMRPCLHIRDWARRLNMTSSAYIGALTLASVKGVLYYDVYGLITSAFSSFGPLSTHELLSSMFLGFRGGLRLKIVVKGVSEGSVWFLPPVPVVQDLGSSFAGQNRLRLKAGQPTPLLPAANNAVLTAMSNYDFAASNHVPYQTVLADTPDSYHTCGASDYAGLSGGPQGTDVLNCSCTFDVEIPYQNIARFVGFGGQTTVGGYYLSSLGTLAVSLVPQYQNRSGTYTVPNVVVNIFVGFADDARLVHHSQANPVYFPTAGAGSYPTLVQQTGYNGSNVDNSPYFATSASNFFIGAAAT